MKRFLSLVLAMVMMLIILVGCGASTTPPNETVQATAPAESPTHSLSDLDRIVTPSILFASEEETIFDFGGSFITPLPQDISMLSDENLSELAYHHKFVVQLYYPCNKEDAVQCGANFAHLLLEAKDRKVYEKVLMRATETFDLLKGFYDMDTLYSWVLVGLFNHDLLVDFFSGEFDEAPNPKVIEQVQDWIPDILDIHDSPELRTAIGENAWFYLPPEEG